MNKCFEINIKGHSLNGIGNQAFLQNHIIALFCSRKCPAGKILDATERFQSWAKARQAIISGFHSPVEQQCMKILLHSSSGVIICPARGIQNMRIPAEWKQPIAEGRMLIISPFDQTIKRATSATCQKRNEFIADVADEIVVIHAEPDSNLRRYISQ